MYFIRQTDKCCFRSFNTNISVPPTSLSFSFWFAAGLAYSNLVYDWVKAAVMFGVINTVSTLDHLDPPQPPKCITMLYVFAETYVELPRAALLDNAKLWNSVKIFTWIISVFLGTLTEASMTGCASEC